MKKNLFFKSLSFFMMGLFSVVCFSCSDSDNGDGGDGDGDGDSDGGDDIEVVEKVGFVVVAGDLNNDLTGGNSIMYFDALSGQELSLYKNDAALHTNDAFTQVSYNEDTKVFTGYIYARGATDLGAAGLRQYTITDGVVSEVGDPVIFSFGSFGNSGVFGNYSYAAAISSGYVSVNTVNGVNEYLIDLDEYAIDGTNGAITGIADKGNNTLVVALYYANTDESTVLITDYQMNVKSFLRDDRIGASYGAWRSARYSQIGADDSGNVYVFSGTGEISGALRINKGENTFDANYMFDLLAASEGNRFRKAFHISGDDFLLCYYNDANDTANTSSSNKYAVVNMTNQSFAWVTGLPEVDDISSSDWADGYDGVAYLPVTPVSGAPAVYAIDAETGVATVCLTGKEGEKIRSVNVIKE